jgi:hypothetical protein
MSRDVASQKLFQIFKLLCRQVQHIVLETEFQNSAVGCSNANRFPSRNLRETGCRSRHHICIFLNTDSFDNITLSKVSGPLRNRATENKMKKFLWMNRQEFIIQR